jgi:hypothetical protein
VSVVLIVIGLLLPYVVYADVSVHITVTAVPKITGGISNFIVTYVNDKHLDLSWTLTGAAVKIMIRGKYGSYPADIPNEHTAPSDGYLVYYGNAGSCSDTIVNLDDPGDANISDTSDTPFTIYYKAWAQKGGGTWFVSTSTGSEESRTLTFLAFVVLALGLMIAAFVTKGTSSGMLRIASVIAWIIMIPLSFNQTWPTGNTFLPQAAAYFSAAMMIIMVAATVMFYVDWYRGRQLHAMTDEEAQVSYRKQVYKITKKKDSW